MAIEKYEIELPDGGKAEIKVDGGWATEDTLSAIATRLKAKSDLFSTTAKDVKDTLDPSKPGSFTHSLNVAEKEVEEFEQGLDKTQKGLAVLSTALGASRDVAAGVVRSTGKLTDINPIVDNVVGQLGRLLKTVGQIEVLGISVGEAATAFGQLVSQVISLSTTIGQRVLDTFDTLSQKGVQSGFAFDDLGASLARAKITQDDFVRALSGSNQGMVAFGGDLEKGAQKFLDTVGIANSEFRVANRAIGLSTMEVADFIAKFIESEKDGLIQTITNNRDLAKFTTMVNQNLSVLAELTGKDVDQMREEFLVNNMAIGAKISLAKAERDGAEGVVSAFKLVEDFLPTVLQPFVAQSVKFDAAIGDIAPLNVFGTLIQDLNTDLDNLRNSSMGFEERQQEAARIVQRAYENIGKATDGGAASLAEFAGVIPSDVLEQFARITMAGIKEQAREQRFLEAGIPAGDARLKYFENQIARTEEVIQAALDTDDPDSALGVFASTALRIEDATSKFTEDLFNMTKTFLPQVVAIIREFYEDLGRVLANENLAQAITDPMGFVLGEDEKQSTSAINPDGSVNVDQLYKNMAQDSSFFLPMAGRQFGGGTMPGTSYLVGESGPEVLTMGRSSGNVTSNAEMTAMAVGADTRLANALSNTTLTTESPAMQKELQNLNRNLKRLLPQALTSNGVY